MDIKDLQKFVLLLVLVGMILGVGFLVLDNFSTATRDITAITNESITIASSTGTAANIPLYSVTSFGNTTQTYSNLTTDPSVNYTLSTGVFVVDPAVWVDGTYQIYYSYYANSTTTDTTRQVREAIEPISTSWLSIIVTIAVLSLIMGLVIRSFGNRR